MPCEFKDMVSPINVGTWVKDRSLATEISVFVDNIPVSRTNEIPWKTIKKIKTWMDKLRRVANK